MVKQVLWAVLFLNTVILHAQTFEKAVFTHKVTRETQTVKFGDKLKVWYNPGNNDWTVVRGSLQNVENDILYLQGKEGIPLYAVQKIKFHDPEKRKVARILGWAGLGLLVIACGFGIGVFLVGTGEMAAYVFGALSMTSFLVAMVWSTATNHYIPATGAEWDVEIVETPRQQVP